MLCGNFGYKFFACDRSKSGIFHATLGETICIRMTRLRNSCREKTRAQEVGCPHKLITNPFLPLFVPHHIYFIFFWCVNDWPSCSVCFVPNSSRILPLVENSVKSASTSPSFNSGYPGPKIHLNDTIRAARKHVMIPGLSTDIYISVTAASSHVRLNYWGINRTFHIVPPERWS